MRLVVLIITSHGFAVSRNNGALQHATAVTFWLLHDEGFLTYRV